jgi:5-methylthioadenosine/S-adenosylhomocysteine deaminase
VTTISGRTLLQGAAVLRPDMTLVDEDVLVDEGRIAAIGAHLSTPHDTEVIDLSGHVLLPGLVDGHRHMWIGGLGAATRDMDLGHYAAVVNGTIGPRFTADDVYAGVLWGCVQAIHAGVSTVADWAHNLPDDAAANANLAALKAAGIRARLYFGGVGTTTSSSGYWERARTLIQRHQEETAVDRITLGAALPGPVMSPETVVREDFETARTLGLPISVHAGMIGTPPVVDPLLRQGLLGPDVHFAHANTFTADDWAILAEHGGAATATPTVELTMGLGRSTALGAAQHAGVPVALGADTVAYGPTDLFTEMRTALTADRVALSRDGDPAYRPTHLDVLRAATAGGATAIDVQNTGSIEVGRHADLIAVDATVVHLDALDPLLAIVRGGGPADVTLTMIGGEVKKRDGRVKPALLEEARDRLIQSRRRLGLPTNLSAGLRRDPAR